MNGNVHFKLILSREALIKLYNLHKCQINSHFSWKKHFRMKFLVSTLQSLEKIKTQCKTESRTKRKTFVASAPEKLRFSFTFPHFPCSCFFIWWLFAIVMKFSKIAILQLSTSFSHFHLQLPPDKNPIKIQIKTVKIIKQSNGNKRFFIQAGWVGVFTRTRSNAMQVICLLNFWPTPFPTPTKV